MFDLLPLTASAEALRNNVLKIPRTEKALMSDLPPGFDAEENECLHTLTLSGDKQAVPAIQKALKRFPGNPTLLNYLQVACQIAKQSRQADAVLKQLARDHPDYLFTRLGLAIKALENDQTEKALTHLGPDLDIRALYPQREVFHVSELTNYYKLAAIVHARLGQPDLALGLKAAVMEMTDDPQAAQVIEFEVMKANLRHTSERMREDRKRRIEVRLAPFKKVSVNSTAPVFQHQEVHELYQYGMDLPEVNIRTLLALPRQGLAEDLARVLDDCAARTASFMEWDVEEEENFAVFHALHLLAEIDGHPALESLLRFLSLHPDAFEFWLGDAHNYAPQLARIIAGDLARCAEWLRSPGIHSRHKGIMIEAMEQLAKSDNQCMAEVVSVLEETLSFVIESPRQDNILDTVFIGHLVSCLTELRSARSLPLIERAYHKDLVELFMVGDLDSVRQDIETPLHPAEKRLPILKQYRKYIEEDSSAPYEEEDDEADAHPLFDPHFKTPAPALETGRNDPCPCGSGKKYKKCCMK